MCGMGDSGTKTSSPPPYRGLTSHGDTARTRSARQRGQRIDCLLWTQSDEGVQRKVGLSI